MFRLKGLLCMVTISSALAGVPASAAGKPLPIPAGSTLRIRLDTLLSDKTNKSGDPFKGVVMDPILVDGQEVIPKYSEVAGHVALAKPSGRIRGVAELRVVIDNIKTEDNIIYPLSSTLEDAQGNDCGKSNSGKGKSDEEGTITGCGKNKKDTLKSAAIMGAVGAAGGASVGVATMGGCDYYGNCYPSSGPGIGADIGIGVGIGAGTALLYSLLKHEKHIVLAPGMMLTFTVNRTTAGDETAPVAESHSQ